MHLCKILVQTGDPRRGVSFRPVEGGQCSGDVDNRAASIAGVEPALSSGEWAIGPVMLGDPQQTADVLTRALTSSEIRSIVEGPPEAVELFAGFAGRS